MRRRWYVEVIGRGTKHARSIDDAIRLVDELEPGLAWRILLRVGTGDTFTVRQGVTQAAA